MDTSLDWWHDESLRWHKGNLHTHTTNSDGERTPEAACAWFRDQGYSFVHLTDHDAVTSQDMFVPGRFIVIPGCEVQAGRNELGHPFHLVGLGLERPLAEAQRQDTQTAIDLMRAAGSEVIIAHPYWSGHTIRDLEPLQGYLGLEVWNTLCELLNGKGHSGVVWDDLLARGRRLLAIAVDDAHWQLPDFGQGWVMVRVARLRADEVLGAVGQGRFYSSSGPAIRDLRLEGRTIWVQCDEAAGICFVSESAHGQCLRVSAQLVTEAEATLPDYATYVRVVCIDNRGRRAWTNPIFFDHDR